MMFFISILYDDSNPLTYEGVQVSILQKQKVVINTKNPSRDYLAAMLLIQKISDVLNISSPYISCSSSVDHFVMDGGELKEENYSDDEIKDALIYAKEEYTKYLSL